MKKIIRTFVIVLALTFSLTSCARVPTESAEPPDNSVDLLAFESLPVLELQSIRPRTHSLREPRLPSGLTFMRSSTGLLIGPGGTTILRGSTEHPIISLEASPSGGHLLVDHASGRFRIYSTDGDRVADIPFINVEDGGAIAWQWKDDLTLVGVAGVAKPVQLPRYPDGDVVTETNLLFLSRPLDDPGTIYRLKTVEPPPGTVIRIEGITLEGSLLLGAVAPSDYLGGSAKQTLGLFDLEHP